MRRVLLALSLVVAASVASAASLTRVLPEGESLLSDNEQVMLEILSGENPVVSYVSKTLNHGQYFDGKTPGYNCDCSLPITKPKCGCGVKPDLPASLDPLAETKRMRPYAPTLDPKAPGPFEPMMPGQCVPHVEDVGPGNCHALSDSANHVCRVDNPTCAPHDPNDPCTNKDGLGGGQRPANCTQTSAKTAPCACAQPAPAPCSCAQERPMTISAAVPTVPAEHSNLVYHHNLPVQGNQVGAGAASHAAEQQATRNAIAASPVLPSNAKPLH